MQPDPRAWRPQAYGRRRPQDLRDPVIEPAWYGIRILAHVSPSGVRLVDVDGDDLAPEYPEIVDELTTGRLADALVIDGFLTEQALRSAVGVLPDLVENPGVANQVTQFFVGGQIAGYMGGRRLPGQPVSLPTNRPRPGAAGEPAPIAFVAVDLVALDDQPLLEIPLLERKRLLESVLAEGERVRRTPFVRQPAGTFILTWRAMGFGGLAYKEANSRYRPGVPNDGWALAAMPRR